MLSGAGGSSSSSSLTKKQTRKSTGGGKNPRPSTASVLGGGNKKHTLSAPALRKLKAQQADILAQVSCPIWECPIMRNMLSGYAHGMIKDKGHVGPFDKLVAQDFEPPADLTGGTQFCRFHSFYKKRYELLRFIEKGLKKNIRYQALYDEVAKMDKVVNKEMELFLAEVKRELMQRQQVTWSQVRNSLLHEAKRLTELWDAQVEDLDLQISDCIQDIQKRQTEDLASEFEKIENAVASKRPHFSTNLLELFRQEPRMQRGGAFTEALGVVEAGRQLEQLQIMKFKREIEREKSLRLSWKVCQQTRQMNGIVDKMQRHRRKEEASREVDRTKLKSRLKTALQRLEKSQKQELLKIREPLIQHVYKVRHLVEKYARKVEDVKRSTLYEAPGVMTFVNVETDDEGQEVSRRTDYPKITQDQYLELVLHERDPFAAELTAPGQLEFRLGADGGAGEGTADGGASNKHVKFDDPTRPKSAPFRVQYLNHQHEKAAGKGAWISCDWCGCRTRHPFTLPAETDFPTSVLRALDNTEYSNVAVQMADVEKMVPGPISLAQQTSKTRKTGNASFMKLKPEDVEHPPTGEAKALVQCCSFKCLRLWNEKHSPVYLRSRRALQIDLMQNTDKIPQ